MVVFSERRSGGRCGAVFSKFEELTVLHIHPPPRGGSRVTSVKAQLDNFGDTEVLENVACRVCDQRGQCVRRQYLARVGPLLVLQLGIYDLATRRKFGNEVRIHADERVSVRVDGRVCDYELVAAVEHLGSEKMTSGHYVCYRRREDGTWLVLNDDGARSCSGPSHGRVWSSSDFGRRQLYLCLYARLGFGEGFAAMQPAGDDVFAEFAVGEVVDADLDGAGEEEDLIVSAMRLSLETAATEKECDDVALAVQRSLEDVGVRSGVDAATTAPSSSGDRAPGEHGSGELRVSRSLQRRDAMVDMDLFGGSRSLRRRRAMVGMEELVLSRSFSSLSIGDQCGSERSVEADVDDRSETGFAHGSVEGGGNCARTARGACLPGGETVSQNTGEVDLGSQMFGPRHVAYDRMTFNEVYDADQVFVRFVLGLSEPRETSEELWLFQQYCRQRGETQGSGDRAGKGIGGCREDSVEASGTLVATSAASGCTVPAAQPSARARPRWRRISGMGEYLAENQYVEREMKRRSFQLVNGQWQGGVRLQGDPDDDAELELFLRMQFRTLQEEVRAGSWGAGRTLGRQ